MNIYDWIGKIAFWLAALALGAWGALYMVLLS